MKRMIKIFFLEDFPEPLGRLLLPLLRGRFLPLSFLELSGSGARVPYSLSASARIVSATSSATAFRDIPEEILAENPKNASFIYSFSIKIKIQNALLLLSDSVSYSSSLVLVLASTFSLFSFPLVLVFASLSFR